MRELEELRKLSKAIRCNVLDMTYKSGANGGHIGGAFSAADILAVLYGRVMKITPENCRDAERDRFILSKGHCSIAHYAVLKEMGFVSEEDLNSFEMSGSMFPTHELMNLDIGVESSNGSLGYGLSMGSGSALNAKLKGLNYKVYVLLGDGECNEGSNWEAAMFASKYNLDNLVAIVDVNGQSLDGFTDRIMPIYDMESVWAGMGWAVNSVNGNDLGQLLSALQNLKRNTPNVILAHTVKGKGIASIEGKTGWHHARLSEQQYLDFKKELVEAND